MNLEGRVATVTGAGRGMGEAIARRLAQEGAAVVVSDIDGENAEKAAARIRQSGGRALALRTDVGEETDATELAATAVREFGGLDIHVNNAGISTAKLFLETAREDMERILRVNLTGAMLCAQAAVRVMLEKRYGRIINIASLSGQRGGIGRTAYGASKAGLELMTKVMSVELASRGITINNVAPGAIATEMAVQMHDQATRDAYHYLIPQRRYGTPEEIASAVAYLASEEAAHICGATLNVDGGYLTAGLMYKHPDIDAPSPPEV
ncbi:glucose 1-dehydrogenase [Roseovarius azorensis]|uniref:Glucose 1-dehydrogenase n=1 Tax=Roseovarius azorensis TaxID=1287727 RepID=A0A1H7QFW1_9RHOB|nr:3-oxoacyl-ACP reductase family protein [Roseovarius azorensis]SEL46991.1 glucose 1-dehydrogenase [Roseovarius azorensis]